MAAFDKAEANAAIKHLGGLAGLYGVACWISLAPMSFREEPPEGRARVGSRTKVRSVYRVQQPSVDDDDPIRWLETQHRLKHVE